MSISIVTVTYNSASKVIPLLKSICDQKVDFDVEVLIIDNNSPDQELLKNRISSFIKKNKLRILTKYRKENLGFGKSCNYGVSLSHCDYILFLNPDTKLLARSLSTIYKHLIQNKADICGGKSIKFNTNKMHRTVFNIPNIRTMLFEFTNLGKIFYISGNFYNDQSTMHTDTEVDGVGGAYFLIKKSSFKKLKGFDENIFMYLEDVDICMRANNIGMKILYCPHSVIEHIGGASSNNKYRIVRKAWFDSREYYSKKHFPLTISLILILLFRVERYILGLRQKSL